MLGSCCRTSTCAGEEDFLPARAGTRARAVWRRSSSEGMLEAACRGGCRAVAMVLHFLHHFLGSRGEENKHETLSPTTIITVIKGAARGTWSIFQCFCFPYHMRRITVAEEKAQREGHGEQKKRLLPMFRGWRAEEKQSQSPLLPVLPSALTVVLVRHQPPVQEVRVVIRCPQFFLQYVIRKWRRRRCEHNSYPPRQPAACDLQYKSAWHLATCLN